MQLHKIYMGILIKLKYALRGLSKKLMIYDICDRWKSKFLDKADFYRCVKNQTQGYCWYMKHDLNETSFAHYSIEPHGKLLTALGAQLTYHSVQLAD